MIRFALVFALLFFAAKAGAESSPRRAYFLTTPAPTQIKEGARLLSLSPAVTETLFALGLGEGVVGRTRYCDRPAAAKAIPSVGGLMDAQLERILSLKPDLVIAQSSAIQGPLHERLRERNVPVLLVFGDRPDEIADTIFTIAKLTNREQAGIDVLSAQRDTIRKLRKRAPPKEKSALFIVSVRPLVIAGPQTFVNDALTLLSLSNRAGQDAPAWPTWSLETLLTQAPDLLIFGGGKNAEKEFRTLTADLYQNRPAPRLLSFDDMVLMRPGPAWLDDVERLARALDDT